MASRGRLALVALFAIMLIPVGTSSLRGLTHILTCSEEVATPFTLTVEPGEDPTVTSSQTIERGEEPPPPTPAPAPAPGRGTPLCGGLSVELSARTLDAERVAMHVPITNHTAHPWQGTVLFDLRDTSIPVRIGTVPPGGTGTDVVEFDLGPGSHELTGSLLIGP